MKHVISTNLGLAAAALLLALAQTASAQSRITYVSDVEYRGTLNYDNAGYSLDYAQSHEGTLKDIIVQAREITSVEEELYSSIYSGIVDALDGDGDLELFQFDIDGPIVVELIGNVDGTITAKVGGFSIWANAEVDFDSYFAEAQLSITSNTLWLTGDYSVVTGMITNLSPNNFHVDVDFDVDLDLIVSILLPILPVIADYVANEVENEAEQFIAQELNNIVAAQSDRVFYNLNDAIPDGEFILGDYDAGQELRDLAAGLFVDLVSGESFKLSIERVPHNYNSVAPLYPNPNHNPAYTTLAAVFNKHVVSLNISDHFFLEVKDIPRFTVYANYYCSWVYCYVPPNADPFTAAENPTDITITHPDGDVLVIPYGLSFDFDSLQALFDANTPPPGPDFPTGTVMASNGSYGYFVNPACTWQIVTGVSGALDLMCDGFLVARQRVVTNYGTYTIVTIADSDNFQMVGSYPNYRITAK